MIKTLLVGHITADLYPEGIRPGGCVLYAARAHQSLGSDVSLCTAFRPEDFVEDLADGFGYLQNQSADISTTFDNRYDADGRRVQYIHQRAQRLEPMAHNEFDVVHLTPVMGEVSLQQWVQSCDARVIGVGLQGYLRGPLSMPGFVGPRIVEFDPSLLRKIDAVFCSDEDIEEHQSLLPILRRYVDVVVVTHGRRGCILWSKGVPIGLGVCDVDERDPTGAGDTFAAAILQGLAMGWPIEQCAKMATALASHTVQVRGVPSVAGLVAAQRRAMKVPVARATLV